MNRQNELVYEPGERGQVMQSAAEIYERFFVPALFDQWPPVLVDMLNIQEGDTVLDVACGTGILARHFAKTNKDRSKVYAVDINEGMLSVARQVVPAIQWQSAAAENLPFDNASFDAVGSQFGIMFFNDRKLAIQEMLRVLKPQGKLAVAVWAALETTPGYAAVTQLLEELFGAAIADEIRAPFVLGNKDVFAELFSEQGVSNVEIVSHDGEACFHSIEEWMYTDINGWTLAGKLNDDQFALLLKQAKDKLQKFTDSTGKVKFPSPIHVAIVSK